MRKSDLQAIYGNGCPTCGGSHAPVNEAQDDPYAAEARRIAKALYNGELLPGQIDEGMVKKVAEYLREAVMEGLAAISLDAGVIDETLALALKRSVFHFSAAKNYQMLRSMGEALRDENGQIRAFADFKEEAAKISQEYNGVWLKTEYDTAVAGAQMSGKWDQLSSGKAIAPWLRYDTVGDSRVRQTHKDLDGIIKNVDDTFWDTWYPPNGFRCRCDVTQLLHGADSGSYSPPDDVPAMFKVNLGRERLALPATHPYFNGVPQHILDQGAKLMNDDQS